MYRIAIITDIHGNIHALNAVIEDLRNKSIDHIYCLGDMIGIGPFSNEVFEALLEFDNISMITGNHDEAVLAVVNNEPYPPSRQNVMPHHEWIAERMERKYITYLSNLPRIIDKNINGVKLHLIHYPMSPLLHNAHLCEDPFDQSGMPSEENFSCISGLDAYSLICFGHDHSEHYFTCDTKTFYNPGSLGCFNQPYARYGIIDIDHNGFKVNQNYVPYDFDSFVKGLKETDIPRKKIVLDIFY